MMLNFVQELILLTSSYFSRSQLFIDMRKNVLTWWVFTY